MSSNLILSPKYKAFLKCKAKVEFLEGTTMAGKTTVGLCKFILKVAESPEKLHIMGAKDKGTAEKNLINKSLGVLDVFGDLTEYNGSGTKNESIPHIVLDTSCGNKIIYVLGYDDKSKWKKALGGQYGCLYIDEINTADIEFVREASMRCDYMMGTLNPDVPSLPVYKEFINCARPLPEWKDETPKEILQELVEEPKPNWVHWFFSFAHNWGLSQEKLDRVLTNTPKGTKLYKNKVLGLRGRSTGLVFSNFDRKRHVMSESQLRAQMEKTKEEFVVFTAGLDTAYSQKSPDTIANTFFGITNKRRLIQLSEKMYNNAELKVPIAPSDTVRNSIQFLERNREKWGFSRNQFIDSADQATKTEFIKYCSNHGCIYDFPDAWKKIKIIDRINIMLGWLATDSFVILDNCTETIKEFETYSWREDKDNEPEDGHDHMINSGQYAWIPYKYQIGSEIDGTDGYSED